MGSFIPIIILGILGLLMDIFSPSASKIWGKRLKVERILNILPVLTVELVDTQIFDMLKGLQKEPR